MSRRHSTTIAKSQTQILGRDSDIAGMIYIYIFLIWLANFMNGFLLLHVDISFPNCE